MSAPQLLDLFCGAGGAGYGYASVGFKVLGIDLEDQPDYPFAFIQADATKFPLDEFDVVHASPPCQAYTTMSNRWRGHGGVADSHLELIDVIRDRCVAAGVPFVIENVVGARRAMRSPFQLHGGMFGLRVYRPRLFESSELIFPPAPCPPPYMPIGIYGKLDGRRLWTRADGTEQRCAKTLEEAQDAMGMPWADWHGCKEAIPPAYTEWIGGQLISRLEAAA